MTSFPTRPSRRLLVLARAGPTSPKGTAPKPADHVLRPDDHRPVGWIWATR